MAFINAATVKNMQVAIKGAFPKSYKWSITKNDHSGISVTLLSSPMDVIFKEDAYSQENREISLSQHHTHNYPANLADFTDKIMSLLEGVEETEYVETGDYGTQPSYYKYINIGSWNKPYVCTATDADKASQAKVIACRKALKDAEMNLRIAEARLATAIREG